MMAENDQQNPLISVIVATWNSEATIGKTLQSLRKQVGADFEVLISDGASTDGTMALVGQYSDMLAHCESRKDGGVYDAWNRVIPIARGDWLMFLGSDDWLERDNVLAELSRFVSDLAQDRQDSAYVYGETLLIEDAEVIERLGADDLPDRRLGLDTDPPFSHTGLLHHRSLFKNFGLFESDFKSAGDYEFLLRTAKQPTTRFHRYPGIVAHMSAGGMSTGASSRLRHYREMYEARAIHCDKKVPLWLRMGRIRATLVLLLSNTLGNAVTIMSANAYRRLKGKPTRKSFR